METSSELNKMKEQMAVLSQKLSNQTIINENVIRNSINNKAKGINKDGRFMIALAIFGMICITADHYLVNWSWAFTIVTEVFFVIAIAFNYYCRLGISSTNALNSDLVKMRLNAMKFRRLQRNWLFFSIPFLIVWLFWLVKETIALSPNPDALLAGCAVGGVIGLIIGIRQYLRSQRQAREMIDEIESLKKED